MAINPATVRTAISARLATIDDLEVRDYIPDSLAPPIAICWPTTVHFDETMGRGVDQYMFSVAVLVDRVDSETGQAALDAYLAASGPRSIKAALEGGTPARTLGGLVHTCRAESASVGSADIGLLTYLYAEFVFMVAG